MSVLWSASADDDDMTKPTRNLSPGLLALQVGVSRQDLHMEDRTLVNRGMRLFGVFDGVSTGGGGAEVATLAVDAVEECVAGRPTPPTTVREAQQLLAAALGKANKAIAGYNQRVGGAEHTSATTAAVLIIFQPLRLVQPALVAVAATVGDSRIQLWRDDSFHTLTLDHSYLASGIRRPRERNRTGSMTRHRSMTYQTRLTGRRSPTAT